MVDRSKFEAEDFLIDSTFQLYCAGKDRASISYWQKYILAHPEQRQIIEEAEKLYFILSGRKLKLDEKVDSFQKDFTDHQTIPLKKSYGWLKIAAVICLSFSIGLLYYYNKSVTPIATEAALNFYSTKAGERRKIMLADGSSVILNAKSSIKLGKGFNETCREVELSGEAYFDVKHDVKKPFKVRTSDFDINVLGTAFNVKAYDDENTSEATLIRGLITMEAKNGSGTITLKPSQKVTFYKNLEQKSFKKLPKGKSAHPEIAIDHYKLIKDSTVLETAWTQNKIEIYDQDFEQIKEVLEKWYNVKIKFKDIDLDKYRFTATFGDESIEQVLSALKQVENFNYEIKGDRVTISK